MESRKNGTDEAICRGGMERQTENQLVDVAGEGEDGTNWEIRLTYIHHHG